jgi:cytochrome c oxidase cbb3-type subunit 3
MSDHPTDASLPGDPYGELIDHEYDGIHEYDNPTPGWWHLIFICSVLFAIPYALFFHWSPIGWSIHESYQSEMDSYNLKVFGKFGDLTPDAGTIAGLMGNPEYMDAMRGAFVTKCASCHTASGAGMVGPNLTDNAYKNVTKIDDIYHVITNGVTAAGMPAWGRQLSRTEIILMSAYVASLRDTNAPGGKAPEGEAIDPWPVVEPIVFEVDSQNPAP